MDKNIGVSSVMVDLSVMLVLSVCVATLVGSSLAHTPLSQQFELVSSTVSMQTVDASSLEFPTR